MVVGSLMNHTEGRSYDPIRICSLTVFSRVNGAVSDPVSKNNDD